LLKISFRVSQSQFSNILLFFTSYEPPSNERPDKPLWLITLSTMTHFDPPLFHQWRWNTRVFTASYYYKHER
jgi:hypothetical protein